MKKKIFTLIIILIPLISFSQNRFVIEPNITLGIINWDEKYYIENVDDTADPLAMEPIINFSGSLIGYGLNIKYLMNKVEIGLTSQLTNFNGNPEIDQFTQRPRNIIFDSFLEYGVQLGYQIFKSKTFHTQANLSGGSFSIIDDRNANAYSSKYFINPGIKLKYEWERININVTPNYKYYSAVGNNVEGNPVFEEFIHTFNLEFGVEYKF